MPGRATAPQTTEPEMSKAERDKAQEYARRMLRTMPSYAPGAQSAPDGTTAAASPELEEWRKEQLRKIRETQEPALTQTPPASNGSGSIATLQEIEESARIQAELRARTNTQAIQMLAEQHARETNIPVAEMGAKTKPSQGQTTPVHDQDLLQLKTEAEARAKAVLDEIAHLDSTHLQSQNLTSRRHSLKRQIKMLTSVRKQNKPPGAQPAVAA